MQTNIRFCRKFSHKFKSYRWCTRVLYRNSHYPPKICLYNQPGPIVNEPINTILNTILYHVLYFRDLKPDNILIGDDVNIKIAGKESSLVITSINYSFIEIHHLLRFTFFLFLHLVLLEKFD